MPVSVPPVPALVKKEQHRDNKIRERVRVRKSVHGCGLGVGFGYGYGQAQKPPLPDDHHVQPTLALFKDLLW
jgi:hypothetical protein